jgi:CDP-4-dehydro-6-deoxyglucose reductase
MIKTRAKVLQVNPLTNTIIQVLLQPETYVAYQPGQYLNLIAGQNSAYFSIANAPLGATVYELHIRHEKNHASSQALLNYLKNHGELEIELPFGNSHIGALDVARPIIFIAGGTGFAPIKAVMEQLLYADDSRSFECYWSAKLHSDLYWQTKLLAWAEQVKTFKHLELYEGKNSTKLMDALIARHQNHLLDYQFLISGPFEMVYMYRDKLLALGVLGQHIFSDAFEFEKGR